ncbi:hypothetical protein [Colwellia sp. E150_009]
MRLFLIILTTFTFTVHADNSNVWAEWGAGGGNDLIGYSMNLKLGDESTNWAIELGYLEDFQVFSYVEDRKNGGTADIKMTTLGLTKNWNNIGSWGYKEAGIGLGIVKGTWANDCSREDSGNTLSGRHDVCDISDGIRFGIPMHASAVFGKYLGIGITVKAFLTTENTHAGIMITIPIGDFTN